MVASRGRFAACHAQWAYPTRGRIPAGPFACTALPHTCLPLPLPVGIVLLCLCPSPSPSIGPTARVLGAEAPDPRPSSCCASPHSPGARRPHNPDAC